jgi:hypothetical protein
MAYTINSFTGVNSDVTIEDGTVNQSTALRFIGKNYAGYGELQNENFYHLLENFAGTGEPARKAIGMLWYDASENRIRFYDGQRFRPASGAEVSVTQPEGQTAGDFWFDSANDQVFVYTGSQYVLVGPQTTSQGQVTQLETGFAKSSLDGSLKPVVRAFVAGDVIFTVSQESFPINTAETENNNLSGFVGNQINSGITLRNTNTDGITTSTTRFWGTASSAANLVVNNALVSSSNFVQVDSPEMTAQLNIRAEGVSGGLTIGAADSFKIYNNSNVAALVNSGGTDISFADSTAIRFRMNANVFRPETDSTNDLGTTSVKFRTIYADTFDGVVTQSQQLEYNGNASGLFARAQVADSPLTIPVRDGTGTVFATTFNGVSTSAQYADLAEKYTTPSELPVGTTVAVCNHPDHEVDVANTSSIAIGVVSLEPAFKMNAEADGQYIGLKGRVPVRVSGPVTKGQAVYAWENGVCTTTATTSLVGIALETNSSEGEKLVECVLKV